MCGIGLEAVQDFRFSYVSVITLSHWAWLVISMSIDSAVLNSRLEQHMSSSDITTERVRAFKAATRHGYFVRGMKFLLPLTAIGVVFAMFLTLKYSMIVPGAGNVTVGAIKVSTDNLKMINPKMDGFTNEGGKYSVTAAEAIQEIGNTDEIQLVRVKAHLTQISKDWAQVTAPTPISCAA